MYLLIHVYMYFYVYVHNDSCKQIYMYIVVCIFTCLRKSIETRHSRTYFIRWLYILEQNNSVHSELRIMTTVSLLDK